MEDQEHTTSKKNTQITSQADDMHNVNELVKKIKIGQKRASVEKIFSTRDGGLQESTLTHYFVQPNIMIEISFDSTGGPWNPENKVIGAIHVYNDNLHFD